MSRRVSCALTGIAGLCLALTGCGGKPVVGALLPTSGQAAIYGQSIEAGMKLALADATEAKQLPPGFEVIWVDTASSPEKATEEARTLVKERGVRLLLGGVTSGEAVDLIGSLEDIGVVCISPSASMPGLTEASPLFYRIYPSDRLEGAIAGEFIAHELKRPTVLLYVGDSQYARGFEPEFRSSYEKAGGRVLGRIELTAEGWQAESASWLKDFSPSAVYVIAYAEHILKAVDHLKAVGFQGPVVTTSALHTSKVLDKIDPAIEGVMFPLPPYDWTSTAEPVAGFIKRFTAVSKRPPDILAAYGYDALRLAIHVMTKAKSASTGKIQRALRTQIGDFTGVTGPVQFDAHGDVQRESRVFIIKDGKIVSFESLVRSGARPVWTTATPTPTATPS